MTISWEIYTADQMLEFAGDLSTIASLGNYSVVAPMEGINGDHYFAADTRLAKQLLKDWKEDEATK